MARKRIGAMLEERGLITEFQLVAALSHQRKWKGKLGRSLIELGYVEENKLFEVLAEQLGMTFVDLRSRQIPQDVLGKIGRKDAEALKAVPLELKPNAVVMAVAEPDLPDLGTRLGKAVGQPVQIVLALESAIEVLIPQVPEKTPVAAVQPVKKAFVRNHLGEIQPLEDDSSAPPAPRALFSEDTPIALDDGELPPPAPAPGAQAPAPAPTPASAPAAPADMESLELPEPESFTSAPKTKEALELDIPDLNPPPPRPPAAATPAASDLPEDLWSMPKPEPSGPAAESNPAPGPASPGMDLPPPPSLELDEIPLPSADESPRRSEPVEPPPAARGEFPVAPEPPSVPAPLPEIPPLDLPAEPSPPSPPLADTPGEKAPPLDSLISSLDQDLSNLTAPAPSSAPPDPDETPSLGRSAAAPAKEETPSWLEKPHASLEAVAPLEGLMTEDVKAEAVAFQEEIHHSHHPAPQDHAARPRFSAEDASTKADEGSGLEVSPTAQIEGRLAKLEEEMRKLRETVESLVLKVRP